MKILSIFLILALLGFSNQVSAAIAFDSAAVLTESTATSFTFAHTITGDDTFLIVHGLATSAANKHFTGATYDGDAMTEVENHQGQWGQPQAAWYIVNGTGDETAHNVVVSMDVAGYAVCTSASYSGVDQVDPIDDSDYEFTLWPDDTRDSFIMVATSTVDNAWGNFGTKTNLTGDGIVAGNNLTERAADTQAGVGDTNGGQSIGAISMEWTHASSGWWEGIVVAFKPVAAAEEGVATIKVRPLKSNWW